MKTKKLIRYAVPCSTRFPSTHYRKGERTWFVEKIKNQLCDYKETVVTCYDENYKETDILISERKLHTIRNNKNNVWTKRMKKVLDGKAVIDLFYWKLPGGRWTKGNEQIVFATLDKDSGCGVQELGFYYTEFDGAMIDKPCLILDTEDCQDDTPLDITELAKNDGLSIDEFKSWFKGYDLSEPLAIIHFGHFRY